MFAARENAKGSPNAPTPTNVTDCTTSAQTGAGPPELGPTPRPAAAKPVKAANILATCRSGRLTSTAAPSMTNMPPRAHSENFMGAWPMG